MYAPSRLRRVAGYFGLVVCVAILIAWGLSGRWWISCGWLGHVADLANGRVMIARAGTEFGSSADGWSAGAIGASALRRMPWWQHLGLVTPSAVRRGTLLIVIPMYIPFVLALVATVLIRPRARRVEPGCCQECGYDLTGNRSGVCPECGTAFHDPTPSKAGGDNAQT